MLQKNSPRYVTKRYYPHMCATSRVQLTGYPAALGHWSQPAAQQPDTLYKASLPVQLHVQVVWVRLVYGQWVGVVYGQWVGVGVGSVGGVAIYLRVTTVLRSPN